MKIKFAGREVDDQMTIRQFTEKLGVENVVFSINREPTAQEIVEAA